MCHWSVLGIWQHSAATSVKRQEWIVYLKSFIYIQREELQPLIMMLQKVIDWSTDRKSVLIRNLIPD